MATKPTANFTFATDLNFSSGPASGFATKIVPGSLPQGFIPGLGINAEWVNYLENVNGQWITWLLAGASNLVEDAHIVETDSAGLLQAARGVFGVATAGDGLRGTGGGIGVGVRGTSGPTGGSAGVVGLNTSNSGAGVSGISTAGTAAAGVSGVGFGTGAGGLFTGGATAAGVTATGGATSGAGLTATATAGSGVIATAGGSAAGIVTTGAGTGAGISATGGVTNGSGVSGTAGGATGFGVRGTAAVGGTTAVAGVQGQSTDDAAGVIGLVPAGQDGYGVVAQPDITDPTRAALRIVPVTFPALSEAAMTALAGDAYYNDTTDELRLRDATSWKTVVAFPQGLEIASEYDPTESITNPGYTVTGISFSFNPPRAGNVWFWIGGRLDMGSAASTVNLRLRDTTNGVNIWEETGINFTNAGDDSGFIGVLIRHNFATAGARTIELQALRATSGTATLTNYGVAGFGMI